MLNPIPRLFGQRLLRAKAHSTITLTRGLDCHFVTVQCPCGPASIIAVRGELEGLHLMAAIQKEESKI